MKKITSGALLIALAIALTHPAIAQAAKNPYGTATIDPAGANETILTISKGDRRADFAYSRLLKLKASTITIYEPFVKKRERFTVVPLKVLFAFVGIKGSDSVLTKALNDYTFRASADQFIDSGAYLAIKRDGLPIAYDEGGPIRIIFSDKSKWAKNLGAWNWSLSSISVK